jgi:hypothetical protein
VADSWIASRLLTATAPTRGVFSILLGVGAPVCVGEDEWACPVCLDGLHSDLRPQHGSDSWQSLMLAQNLARTLLACFVEDGGTLRTTDTAEPVVLEKLFGTGI